MAFLVNAMSGDALASALELYEMRYESLLTLVRIAVLGFSGIFVWLTLSGRSAYPRWVAILNPILLITASFVVFLVAADRSGHSRELGARRSFPPGFG